jgi:TonB family protein
MLAASFLVLGFAAPSGGADKQRKDAADAEHSCAKGRAADCRRLGVMKYYGHGVEKDVAQAAALFQQACDGGDSMGCSNLGLLYETGEGVTKDKDRTKALYGQACDRGEVRSCIALKRLDPSEHTTSGLRMPPDTGEQPPPAQGRGRPGLVGPALDEAIDNQVRKELQRNAQLGLPTGRGQNIGGLQFDPQGADFTAWVNQFRIEVYKNWILPPMATLGWRGHVDLEFTVNRVGRLTGARLLKSSGTPQLDRAALQAVTSSKFLPLPADYSPESLTMMTTFVYNDAPTPQGPQARSEASPAARTEKFVPPSVEAIGKPIRDELQQNGAGAGPGRLPVVHGLKFDPQGADFTIWVKQFCREVYRNWKVPDSIVRKGVGGHVEIEFTVERDSRVGHVRIVRSSGTPEIDRAAEKAIKASAFRYLPADYTATQVTMVASLAYNETAATNP